jgi:hypothetical protein
LDWVVSDIDNTISTGGRLMYPEGSAKQAFGFFCASRRPERHILPAYESSIFSRCLHHIPRIKEKLKQLKIKSS